VRENIRLEEIDGRWRYRLTSYFLFVHGIQQLSQTFLQVRFEDVRTEPHCSNASYIVSISLHKHVQDPAMPMDTAATHRPLTRKLSNRPPSCHQDVPIARERGKGGKGSK